MSNFLRKIAKGMRALASMDPLWWRALRYGVAPSLEHRHALRLARPAFVVDIGANRGQFALAARRWWPQAAIVSFEPLSRPAATFRRIFAFDERVRLYPSAIGPVKGVASMHVSREDDSSSLLPIGPQQILLFPETAESHTEPVDLAPLDAFLNEQDIISPALLKIDVQGYELRALEGCERLLHRFSLIYVECSFVELYEGQARADEIISWLYQLDFRLQGIYNLDGSCRQSIQGDFLFVHE